MDVILNKRPKSPIIIEGFPGFGLVGTIATEFLIQHLKTEQIGKIILNEMPAIVAIHESKIVEPFGIFYNQKYNIIILHAINAVTGIEWKIAEAINKMATELKAKEVISIESVGSEALVEDGTRVFYYSKNKKNGFDKIGVEPLREGIIIGVTGAVLLNVKAPISCVFAETHSSLPDSKSAAKIIEVLDKYLGLDVDYKPLLEQADKFEKKLKRIMEKSKEAEEMSDKKKLSYVG